MSVDVLPDYTDRELEIKVRLFIVSPIRVFTSDELNLEMSVVIWNSVWAVSRPLRG